MNIYIDEAGAFIPPKGNRRYSLVLALVVPTAAKAEFCDQFLRLRNGWPHQAIEIKESKLDEDQAAQVLELLAMHGVIAEYYAIDMALHPDAHFRVQIPHRRCFDCREPSEWGWGKNPTGRLVASR
jgi:hypothetical protein